MKTNDFESDLKRATLCEKQESCKACKIRKDCPIRKSFYKGDYEAAVVETALMTMMFCEFTKLEELKKVVDHSEVLLRKQKEEMTDHPEYSNE